MVVSRISSINSMVSMVGVVPHQPEKPQGSATGPNGLEPLVVDDQNSGGNKQNKKQFTSPKTNMEPKNDGFS